MTDPSPAASYAARIRDLVPTAVIAEHPDREVSWEPRPDVRPETRERFRDLRVAIAAIDVPPRVGSATEGVFRVVLGGDRARRGGERFTAAIVHVVADDEPIRTVILPLE